MKKFFITFLGIFIPSLFMSFWEWQIGLICCISLATAFIIKNFNNKD